MKKLFIILSIIPFLISSYAFAEDTLRIEVEEKTGNPKETVTLNADITNNPGILALLFDITYDQERLELLSAEDKGLVPGAVFSETPTQYPYTCLYNSAAATDTKDTGTLFALTFKVKDDAKPGKAFVKLDCASGNIFNVNLDDVAVSISDGGILISGEEEISTPDNTTSDTSGNTPNNSSGNASSGTSGNASGGSYSGSGSSKKTDAKPAKGGTDKEAAVKTEADKIILTIGKTEAKVFGKIMHNDVAPVLRKNRTMLPARFVAEQLGADVFWNEKEEKVTIKKNDITILIYIGSDKAYINGKEEILDSPAFIENSRTYTPLRFVAEGLQANVLWLEETMEVVITR